jgi:hypothetical protein
MPLATLHWKLVGTQTLVTPGIAACLDAIYTLGTSTTYADGTTRTPGTDSAWTWTRQQISGVTEACFGSMPYTNGETIRFVLAGSATARTYTLLTPDTASSLTNALLCAMNRGQATTTGNWYDANGAYGAGASGFWRAARPFTSIGFDKITMYENEEECTIHLSRASDGAVNMCGLWSLDPKDTAAAAAETSGRRWMLWGTGSNANPSATWLINYFIGNGSDPLTMAVNSGYGHCGVFNVGANTVTAVSRTVGPLGATAFPVGWQTTGGKLPLVQDVVFGGGNSSAAGVWRAAAYTRQAVGLTSWMDGATTKGYYIGSSTTAAQHGILLLRN